MRSCAFESRDEMDGDDAEVFSEAVMLRADFLCFVLARTMAASLDQIRRLFVSKAVGKHHPARGAVLLLDVPYISDIRINVRAMYPLYSDNVKNLAACTLKPQVCEYNERDLPPKEIKRRSLYQTASVRKRKRKRLTGQ